MTGPRLLLAIAIAIGAMCAGLAIATGDPRAVIRWTARTSLVLFALAYVARPAVQLWPRPLAKRLLAERKWLGDGFAVSHLAHLAGIAALAARDWDAFVAARDLGELVGAAVFVIVFAMAITSIDRVRRAMSRRSWTALHRTGMHAAWFVFAAAYAPALARETSRPVAAAAVAALIAIAAVRAAAWRRGARRRASVAP